MGKRVARIGRFVEERTGLPSLLRASLNGPTDPSERWLHTFANATVVLFVVQAVTGVLLMLTYTPSVDDAWSSVAYIQQRVTGGWFVRGLHSYGGEAMLVVAILHLWQAVARAAYRAPREVSWWTWLAIVGIVLGLLVTGFRLPWDQNAWWALQVELNVAASMPVLGPMIQELAAGGAAIGQGTLTRLHALHVVVLPGVGALALRAHRALRRRHARESMATQAESAPFFPGQLARDVGFVVVVLGAVAALTAWTGGPELGAPAEPSRDHPARPEWFLLPLYELRMLLPAAWELVATVVLPGAATAFLLGLPFLDRRGSSEPRDRLRIVLPVAMGGLAMAALAVTSMQRDDEDVDFRAAMIEAEARGDRALALARNGVPPEGPLEMLAQDPATRGREVYRQHCTSCHVLDGQGKRKAPDHTGFASRAWIRAMLLHPRSEHFFDNVDHEEEMPSQADELTEEELAGVTELLFSFGHEGNDPEYDEELAASGEAAFERECLECHMLGEDGDYLAVGGPQLRGWASRTWILRHVREPGGAHTYGELHDMPSFGDQLDEHDLRMVTAYLRQQRFAEPDPQLERLPGDGPIGGARAAAEMAR